jgi:hypothetical protein
MLVAMACYAHQRDSRRAVRLSGGRVRRRRKRCAVPTAPTRTRGLRGSPGEWSPLCMCCIRRLQARWMPCRARGAGGNLDLMRHHQSRCAPGPHKRAAALNSSTPPALSSVLPAPASASSRVRLAGAAGRRIGDVGAGNVRQRPGALATGGVSDARGTWAAGWAALFHAALGKRGSGSAEVEWAAAEGAT